LEEWRRTRSGTAAIVAAERNLLMVGPEGQVAFTLKKRTSESAAARQSSKRSAGVSRQGRENGGGGRRGAQGRAPPKQESSESCGTGQHAVTSIERQSLKSQERNPSQPDER